MLTDYLLSFHREDLKRLLMQPDEQLHYSIVISFFAMGSADLALCDCILRDPRKSLELCDKSAIKAQEIIIAEEADELSEAKIKNKVHIRVSGVPSMILESGQIGELFCTNGIVVRQSSPGILKLIQRYLCKACEHITVAKLDFERNIFPEVKLCEACKSKSLSLIPTLKAEDSADYQEIKIQQKCKTETSSSYSVGLQAILLHDLVDKCVPGDSVEITGVLVRRWGPLKEGARAEAVTVLLVNHVTVRSKVSNSQNAAEVTKIFQDYWLKYQDKPLMGRNKILTSICPQLFGMFTVKLALAVVLAGGIPKVNETGVRIRGEPHLLMIGDPGTGKSHILRMMAKLAPRSILTTGIGTSAAGLTAAATRDSDGWHLEAGALVLADGGVCCVDEFTTMNAHDRAALHEAMEQQTISIAKAGIVSTLNSRCSVIAATNPIGGKFVDGVEGRTRLGTPLLSRFDLILHLKDARNIQWDQMTTNHVLTSACEAMNLNSKTTEVFDPMDLLKSEEIWKTESLREYFVHIHSLEPPLNDAAEEILSAAFRHLRKDPERTPDRTTNRLLESLVRLAEGHARLMYKNEVDFMDAIIATILVGILPMENDIGGPFAEDPKTDFDDKAIAVLNLLELDHLITYLNN